MRVTLLLLVFISLACLFTKGHAEGNNEVDNSVDQVNDIIPVEYRVKRNAQQFAKKKNGRGRRKKNNKKGNRQIKKSNKKKNFKTSNNRNIKKNRKNQKGNKKNRRKNGKNNRSIKKSKNKQETKKKNRRKNGKNTRGNKKSNRRKNVHGQKKKEQKERNIKPTARGIACSDEVITVDKTLRIKQMDNRMRQAKRAPKFHKVIGAKCTKATAYTTAASRVSATVNRAGGKESCKTDPTETIASLKKCQEDVCAVCSSPLDSAWQALYPTCESTSKEIKIELEAAQTCDAINAANAKAKAKNSECAGPFSNVTTVKLACAAKNKECKTLMETARTMEVDCVDTSSVDLNDTNANAVDETQDNRTSIVEASLDTFISGTGDLLNTLGLSSGEGSDGELSAEALSAADNITRSDTISDNPTCEGLLSYSANLIDFSKSTEGKDSLSEEQTAGAATQLGTINNLVASGAAGTALAGCNTRQSRFSVAIFRWIIWRCYFFFFNWLRKSRCRRLQRMCVKRGEPWCSIYCKVCEIPTLTGGIWWQEPVFTYEWYPVDPCLDRTQCVFQCPQCSVAMTTAGAGGRRAKMYQSFLKKMQSKK